MQSALAAASGREVVLQGRQGRKLFFEQLEVKVISLLYPIHCVKTCKCAQSYLVDFLTSVECSADQQQWLVINCCTVLLVTSRHAPMQHSASRTVQKQP